MQRLIHHDQRNGNGVFCNCMNKASEALNMSANVETSQKVAMEDILSEDVNEGRKEEQVGISC